MSPAKRTAALALLVLTAAALLLWEPARRTSAVGAARPDQPAASPSPELEQLRDDVRRLHAEVGRLRAQAQAEQASQAQPSVPGAPSAQPTAVTPAPQRRQSQGEYKAFLDARLDEEAQAPPSPRTQGLSDRIRDVLPASSRLVSLKCGEGFCRALTSHPDMTQYQAFQSDAFMSGEPLWAGPVTFIREESGGPGAEVRSAMYLGLGDALPAPPDAPREAPLD